MRRHQLAAVVTLLLSATAGVHAQTASDPAAGWRGVKVLPKLKYVIKVGDTVIQDNTTAGKGSLTLPWVVQDVNGAWLWVGNSRKGWVQWTDVVTLDQAPQYYTDLINRGEQKAWAYNLRAIAWDEKGDLDLAVADFGEKLRLEPDAIAYNNRGATWNNKKENDKAIADYNQAIRLDPSYTFAYINRGRAWKAKKEYDKAIADYNQAIRLDPNADYAYNNIAWLQATCPDARYRDGKSAVKMATKACELSGWAVANTLGTLAAAYAEAGDFDHAIKWQQKAIDLNLVDADFVKGAKERVELYRQRKPYRE